MANHQGVIDGNGTYPSMEGIIIAKGPAKITFGGTFGSAKIKLQEKLSSVWVDMLDEDELISYDAPNSYSYNIHSGNTLRFVVTESTGTTKIPWAANAN